MCVPRAGNYCIKVLVSVLTLAKQLAFSTPNRGSPPRSTVSPTLLMMLVILLHWQPLLCAKQQLPVGQRGFTHLFSNTGGMVAVRLLQAARTGNAYTRRILLEFDGLRVGFNFYFRSTLLLSLALS